MRRPRLATRFPVLVTMRLRAGLASLRSDDAHALVAQVFAVTASAEFRVVQYSVQTNHLHALVEARDESTLTRGMTGLAVRIARGLNRLWRRAGAVFGDRFHARQLRSPREVRNALVYVLQNARKHGSWRARLPDAYSSGPSFDGWKEAGRNVAESSARSLARARTWLLSLGWRRHGLIDPREVPLGSLAPS
ncbi:MAG: hypothetical protein ACREVS_20040 [Burkholderiales bacterium]